MSQTETNIWHWWQEALAGRVGPMSEGQPEQGYYRTRFKDGQWEPVAIWKDEDGAWLAMRGERIVDAGDAWNFCRTHPVSYEAYQKAIDGAGWDDEPPAPAIGHNLPSDPFEALRLEYEAEKEQAEAFMKAPIKTQADADRAAILSKRVATIAKKATDLHKVEKQPHLDAGRVVDTKWRDLKEEPDLLSKRLKRHMDDFLREQQRVEAERQRAAQAEADRKRRDAEDAARRAAEAAGPSAEEQAAAQANAERLAREAAEAERATQTRNAAAGRTGARVSLRTFVSAEITDYDALVMALKDRPEIRDVVNSLANRAAKAGVELAGMKIKEEQRAA
ncbi:hypothetical protein ASG25_10840 [Rhizobium sp. Leaf384]|uniref:hypothetical protein n=1 Tax=Rhizobium sp. Leaf384 TaxID=1736358 RepID=UPI000712333A|nr:hypothetical protein [Rhizobium sp. Leaf384]KQS79074.1 hypothetical protein ASG25_10840 [Rhizobium sp. Leaf384]